MTAEFGTNKGKVSNLFSEEKRQQLSRGVPMISHSSKVFDHVNFAKWLTKPAYCCWCYRRFVRAKMIRRFELGATPTTTSRVASRQPDEVRTKVLAYFEGPLPLPLDQDPGILLILRAAIPIPPTCLHISITTTSFSKYHFESSLRTRSVVLLL